MSDDQFGQLMVAIKEMDAGMQELKQEVTEIKERVVKIEDKMDYLVNKVTEHDHDIFLLKRTR